MRTHTATKLSFTDKIPTMAEKIGKQYFFGQIVYQKDRPERGMGLTVPTRFWLWATGWWVFKKPCTQIWLPCFNQHGQIEISVTQMRTHTATKLNFTDKRPTMADKKQGKQHFFGQIVYQKGRPERGMKLTVPTRLANNIVSSLTTTAETNSALPKRLPLPDD